MSTRVNMDKLKEVEINDDFFKISGTLVQHGPFEQEVGGYVRIPSFTLVKDTLKILEVSEIRESCGDKYRMIDTTEIHKMNAETMSFITDKLINALLAREGFLPPF